MSDNERETAERIARTIVEIITELGPRFTPRCEHIAGIYLFTIYDGDMPLGKIEACSGGVRFFPLSDPGGWFPIASEISDRLISLFAFLNTGTMAKGELVDRIVSVRMNLGNFERFLEEHFDVKRIARGEWDISHGERGSLWPMGIVTALEVGDGLSVAVWRYEWENIPREDFTKTDADGNVWEALPSETYNTHAKYYLASSIRSNLQRIGALPERISAGSKGEKTGPNARTEMRGQVFKRLKDSHPEWSQAKVAMEACGELGEVTEDTVRNTYRQLGWKWERADRIR